MMHIVGIETSDDGRTFFLVKNSWGTELGDKGYWHMSEAFFTMNLINIIIPRSAVSESLLKKLDSVE